MTDLIERLKTADAGSREMDASVTVALHLDCRKGLPDDHESLREVRPDDQCAPGTYWFVCRSGMSLRTAEPVTTSIDAALALFAKVLPGWEWLARSDDDCGAFVNLTRWDFAPRLDTATTTRGRTLIHSSDPTNGGRGVPIFARAAPLALCAAILIAKETNP